MMKKEQAKYGSPAGLVLTIVVGFVLYFMLKALGNLNIQVLPDYAELVTNIEQPGNQILWFLINFTEPEFFAGAITTVFLFIGGFIAYALAVKKTKYMGIEICYGQAHIWPWVLASEVLSLFVTEYLFGYLHMFDMGLTWIPTFICVVSVAPSMVLMYGPNVPNLLTGVFLGGVMCTPTAYIISQATASLNIPGAVNNVLAMAVTGIIAGSICHVLPWIKKTEVRPTENINAVAVDTTTAFWVLRRTVADFTEPQFWGSDIASAFVIVGMIIEFILCPGILSGGGSGMLPAVILSQFISGGIGVFLYTQKYRELGWYATYVPVVCTAPAVVLMYGDRMVVILVASIISGIIGAPLADWFNDRKPAYIHGTVSNVMAMAVSTVIVAAAVGLISWIG